MLTQLYFIADPMCSWCWGFRSSWQTFLAELPPSVIVKDLMGGLAPDSDEPMDATTQAYVQSAWRSVGDRTGAKFNHEFWDVCQPRRSTYPACRAVISAGLQSTSARTRYFEAVQQAYYLEARNPSQTATLIALAGEIGLDSAQFQKDLQRRSQMPLAAVDNHQIGNNAPRFGFLCAVLRCLLRSFGCVRFSGF